MPNICKCSLKWPRGHLYFWFKTWEVRHKEMNGSPKVTQPQIQTWDLIRWLISTLGEEPGFSRWAQCNHKGPCQWKEEAEEESQGRRREGRSGVRERCFVAGFEDGGRSHWPGNTGSLWKLQKGKEMASPLEILERVRALLQPGFSPRETHLRLLLCRTGREYILF